MNVLMYMYRKKKFVTQSYVSLLKILQLSWVLVRRYSPLCTFYAYCQAQFKLASSVPAQLGTETHLIVSVRPTPDKYTDSTKEAEIWYRS